MIDEPSIADEKAARLAQRDMIAALFRSHPLQEIDNAILKAITPHYQQRISECRRQLGMTIQNIRVSVAQADGTLKRLDGNYRLLTQAPHGRDAGTFTSREWTHVEGPFTEPWTLKP